MTLIDIHTHLHPSRLIDALRQRGSVPYVHNEDGREYVSYGGDKRYLLRPEMTDIDSKIAEMDRIGIDVSILSVTLPGIDGLGDDASRVARTVNDQMAEIAASRPDRLGWVALLPMEHPTDAAREFRRAVSMGANGAVIFSNVAGRPLDLDIDGPVFEVAAELNRPILLHPTYPLSASTVADFELTSTLGYLFDTSTAALRLALSGLFTRYPELKFVVCHAGAFLPYQIGRIDHQALHREGGKGPIPGAPSDEIRKMYIDSVCQYPPALRLALDFFGADHVMMGSDHPLWPMATAVDTLDGVELSAGERRLVEGDNAADVFRWHTDTDKHAHLDPVDRAFTAKQVAE